MSYRPFVLMLICIGMIIVSFHEYFDPRYLAPLILLIRRDWLVGTLIIAVLSLQLNELATQIRADETMIGRLSSFTVQFETISQRGNAGLATDVETGRKIYIRSRDILSDTLIYHIRGTPEIPEARSNPGEFNFRIYLASQGCRLMIRVDSIAVVGPRSDWRKIVFQRIHEATTLFSDTYRGMAAGVLVGQKQDLTQSDRDLFRLSGLSHFFALSGFHVGLLMVIVWSVLSQLTSNGWIKTILIIIIMIVYIHLVGLKAPLFRAVMMMGLYLSARYARRPVAPFRILWLSAVANLACFPLDCLNLGFWLSYLALASILFTAHRVKCIPWLNGKRFSILKKYARGFLILNAPFIVTSVIVFPLFGIVPLASIPNNTLLMIPLTITIYGMMVQILTFPLLPDVSVGIGFLIDELLMAIRWMLDFNFNSLRFEMNQPGDGYWLTLLILGYIGLLCWSQPKLKLIYSVLVLSVSFASLALAMLRQDWLHIRMFDVGQAQAILIQQGNQHLMYDAGKPLRLRLSKRSRLAPIIRRLGVDSIDCLLISHDDFDHYGDRFELPVRQIYHQKKQLFMHYPDTLSIGSAMLRRFPLYHPYSDENDRSQVYQLVFGHLKLLLTGDIGNEPETELIRLYGQELTSTVLQIPHHGSRTSSSVDFIQTVKPEVALLSVGQRNRYQHPHSSVMKRYQHIPIFRTDRDGYVHLVSNGEHVWRIPTSVSNVLF